MLLCCVIGVCMSMCVFLKNKDCMSGIYLVGEKGGLLVGCMVGPLLSHWTERVRIFFLFFWEGRGGVVYMYGETETDRWRDGERGDGG